jgi:serine/threonine protein kinase
VGKGTSGTVFEADLIDSSESDGGRLALKYCQGDQLRARREVDILKLLKHENIVRFIGNAEDGSYLVIIMELITGMSLEELLEKSYNNGSSEITLLSPQLIMKQLAEGMTAVHAEKIAHRDLKPGNLIINQVNKLVIVDFGLSKKKNADSTITSANDPIDTFLYMSPEQMEGDIDGISFPSDIWSIGIIWHEILTYYTPFETCTSRTEPGNSSSRSQRRQFSKVEEDKMITDAQKKGPRELPMLRGQPEKVPNPDTIAKCLNVNKEERFQDAKDFRDHLTGLFEDCQTLGGAGGTTHNKKFCTQCVAPVSPLFKFCGQCGLLLYQGNSIFLCTHIAKSLS